MLQSLQITVKSSECQQHYGQTRIQPMRLDTKDFFIDTFLGKQDIRLFFIKSITIFCKGFTELQPSISITKPQF